MKCEECERLPIYPTIQPKLCALHFQKSSTCSKCIQSLETCCNCAYRIQGMCCTLLCKNKSLIPLNNPRICLPCFDKRRKQSNIMEQDIDWCIFCLKFTVTGRILAYSASPRYDQFYSCIECAFPKIQAGLLVHVPITNVAEIILKYIWSVLKVGDDLGITIQVEKKTLLYHETIIKKIDVENGIYFVEQPRISDLLGLTPIHDGGAVKKAVDMLSIHS